MSNFLNGIAFLLFAYYLLIDPFLSLAKIKKSNATWLNGKKLQKAKQADGSFLFYEPKLMLLLKLAKYLFFIALIINLFAISNKPSIGTWVLIFCLSIPSLLNIYYILININTFIKLDNNAIKIRSKKGMQEMKLEEIENAAIIFKKPTAFTLIPVLKIINTQSQEKSWSLSDLNLRGYANEILAALKELRPEINTEKQYL